MHLSWFLRVILMGAVIAFLGQSGQIDGANNIYDESRKSVTYVESPKLGNFFLFEERSINASDPSIYATMTADKECVCRYRCLWDSSCMAMSSIETENRGFNCRFANQGPMNTTLHWVRTATYFYRHASLTGKTWGIMKDKLYYFELSGYRSFNESKEICKSIPGFRLAIIRTAEIMWLFYGKHRTFFLDLHKGPDGTLVWGDSSPFTKPENVKVVKTEPYPSLPAGKFNKPVFVFYIGELHDHVLAWPERAICQANPLGVEW